MQAWKLKRKAQKKPVTKLKTRLLGALLVLSTCGVAIYGFPGLWNQAVAMTGLPVPTIEEKPFRLGLDLQGGTHLVYEANMAEIPEDDRISALEGVRDVIERRVDAFGVSEPVVQTVTTGGVYRLIVELAGVLDANEAIGLIGETPVLEFKEPGAELTRDLTEDEQDAIDLLNEGEREQAADVLRRARAGENFDALVAEFSIDPNKEDNRGISDGLTAQVEAFAPIVDAIVKNRVRTNGVVPVVIETARGLEVVKFLGTRESAEMQLSHILKCFEGKTVCTTGASALDASLAIRALKDQATAENFADLATEHSDDQGGFGGGDLGWVIPGETVPAFELAARQTPVGSVSDVVETEFGYHIILKRDERTLTVYDVQRVIMKHSTAFDVVGDFSPWKNTELSGKHLGSAAVEFDPNTGSPYVALRFNPEGADLFAEMTSRLVGQPIAIFLDGEPISIPTVQSAITGGQAVISGNFTIEEAKTLAQRLNAGALPVPVDLLSQETVGPTLGKLSLEKSITAAFIGFGLVALFMIAAYRLPGLVAVAALVFYALLNLALYRFFGVTITLAGIAGFVLSLGIAVDANVLILERVREEYAAGRDFGASAKEGWARAWTAIRDGNVTTLIAAAVLFWFSSSFIKGFALTLGMGVFVSMLTAIYVTRVYFDNVFDVKAFRSKALTGFKRND